MSWGAVTRTVRAVGLALLLLVTTTPPAHAVDYVALCGTERWTDQNPSDCRKEYRVYQITANRPRLVFHVRDADAADWERIRAGYRSAEDWCKDRPIACGLIVAVAYQGLQGLWAQARS